MSEQYAIAPEAHAELADLRADILSRFRAGILTFQQAETENLIATAKMLRQGRIRADLVNNIIAICPGCKTEHRIPVGIMQYVCTCNRSISRNVFQDRVR